MKYPRAVNFPRLILRHWKTRHAMRRNLAQAQETYHRVLRDPARTQEALLEATFDYEHNLHILQQFESEHVIWKAERMALDVPNYQERPTWWKSGEDDTEPVYRWLSERGMLGVLKLIHEERRKNWEWRIKVLTPILTILIAILGLLVALVSLLLKFAEQKAPR